MAPTPHPVRGTVKWFDQTKGFGFVVADDGGPDILLHANVLRNFGQNSIADTTEIEILVQETARGMQATQVLSIGEADCATLSEMPSVPGFEGDLEDLEICAARVKWFDKAKGFGFANIFGRTEDVFIHIETLRRYGFADLQPGEAICIRVAEGERGLMAVEVRSWDMATRS
ncbi:cold-shock protein [Loktanella sp. 22II-4b]|nr:cold-shock protein [Loktanella sp. 22II-4b]